MTTIHGKKRKRSTFTRRAPKSVNTSKQMKQKQNFNRAMKAIRTSLVELKRGRQGE